MKDLTFSKVARPALAAAFVAGTMLAGTVHAETDPTMQPRPAEILPKAAESLLLDVTQAGSKLVAVGQRGHILISEDGKEWKQQEVPTRAGLISVNFPSANVGYAVGKDKTVLKTTDGGKTWNLINHDPSYDAIQGAEYRRAVFFDENNGYITGAFGTFLQTTDGGKTFTTNSQLAEQQEEGFESAGLHINDLIKLGDGSLVMVGEAGLIRVSRDNGATWRMTRPVYAGAYFGAIPVGQSGLIVYGQRGTVYRTDNIHAVADQDPEEFSPFQFEEDEYFEQPLSFHGFTAIKTPNPNALMGHAELGGGKFALVGQNAAVYTANVRGNSVNVIKTDLNEAMAGAAAFNGTLITTGLQGVNPVAVK